MTRQDAASGWLNYRTEQHYGFAMKRLKMIIY
jgi:hypothetical protein